MLLVTTRRRAVGLAAIALVLAPVLLEAQRRPNMDSLGAEAVRLTQEYLRINTTNPPGNETRAVEFFARILAAEGIPFDSASSAPGRGNIWARLRGGDAPALVLLHHSDVVSADPRYWSVDPFSGEVRDGYMYGRGALDTKGLGIAHLMAFLALHRSGATLDRDVLFVATADEEAGGEFGAGWLVRERPEIFRNVGFLLNEGGGGSVEGDRRVYGIEVTQKVPFWVKLTATGTPGHGSRPPVASAVDRLIRALARLEDHEFEPRIGPAVDSYFKGMAEGVNERWQAPFRDITTAVRNRETLLRLQLDMPSPAALTRNTCTITMLRASDKVNVIPPDAEAQVDCRLVPEQDHAEFLRELTTVINDPGITIETVLAFSPAVSPTDTPLWNSLERVTRTHVPDAVIIPSVLTGFTDSHFFRDLGIVSYGYSPFLVPSSDAAGVHGNDERLSLENIRRGARMMYEIVADLTQRTPARR